MRTPGIAAMAVATVLLLVALVPLGIGQGSGTPTIERLDAPDEVTPLAGAARSVPILVKLADNGGGLAGIEVQLVKDGAETVKTALAPSGDPLVWHGNLTLDHTTPPGTYTLQAVASDLLRGTDRASQTLEVLPLASLGVLETSVSFGEAAPNGWLGPATVTYRNLGNVPLDVALSASSFQHEDGEAEISAEHLDVRIDGMSLGRAGTPVALDALPVGQGAQVSLWLYVPSGASQYIPAGDYAGTIDLASEVSS